MATIDLTGMRFGRLTATGQSERKSNVGALWECLCDCGRTTVVNSLKLRRGKTKSCGCYRDERIAAVSKTHGMSNKTRTYKTWKEMRQRCNNPNNDKWKWYGGRGIRICSRWDIFEAFLQDMGERPEGMTLDRVDNDGDYEMSNCVWASHKDQTRKQLKNKLNMESAESLRADRVAGMTYKALAAKYGIDQKTAYQCVQMLTWT